MNRKECCETAIKLTYGDRNDAYGNPTPSLTNIAQFWSNYKTCPCCGEPVAFTAYDVGLMMVLLKLSRLRKDPHHWDSWVDICGWSACGGETLETDDD